MMLHAINTFSMAEDNVVNQELATTLLTKWGNAVTMADNGKRVLEILETQPFDLVLMDVQMPGIDGLEATAEIRRREKGSERHIPIIAMTAHTLVGDKERLRFEAVAKSRIAGCGSGDSGQPHGIRHLPAGSFYEVEAHSRKNRIEPSASGTE